MTPGSFGNDNPRRGEAGMTMIELLIVLVFIAVLASIVIWTSLYAFDAARLHRSVSDLRTVANAIEQYQIDHGGVLGGGLQPISTLQSYLGPINPNLPDKDGWGFDFQYEDIVVAGKPGYRVYSYGKLGVSDGVVTGTWVDFYTDSVIENGSFVQSKY